MTLVVPIRATPTCLYSPCLLPHVLFSGTAVDTPTTWARELRSSSRIVLRKALAAAAGDLLDGRSRATDSVTKFAEQIVAPLSAIVKAPRLLLSPSPLEAHIALGVLLGRKPREAFVKSGLGTAQKPGFLVLDKAHTELNTAEEEQGLLHAAQAATTAFLRELTSAKTTEHCFCTSPPRALVWKRAEQQSTLKAVVKGRADRRENVLRDTLSRRATSDGKQYPLVLAAAASDPATKDLNALEEPEDALVVELITLAHAREIYGVSPMWTTIPLRARLDPRALAEKHVERLLSLVLDSNQLEELRMSSGTTPTGIQPTLLLPRFIARIREALDPS